MVSGKPLLVGTSENSRQAMTGLAILGADGMLGQSLVRHFRNSQIQAGGREDADVTNVESLRRFIPEGAIVINASAYTNVDDAEDNEGLAKAINADGAANVAQVVGEKKGRLIHISTDYIFDGQSSKPYVETSPGAPRSAYGRSKFQGEKAVQKVLPRSGIILRTAWLYGFPGKSFPRSILQASRNQQTINVVSDQWGQPTWTSDVSQMIESLIERNIRCGVFHGTNSGKTSWSKFAKAVFELAGLDPSRVKEIAAKELPRKAQRPTYSVLSHGSWLANDLPAPRPWQDALYDAWNQELNLIMREKS